MASNELTITLARADLITTLTDKRVELEAEYDAQIAKIDAEITGIPKAAEALKDWHIAIADLLGKGDARMTAKGEVVPVGDVEIPDKPSSSNQSRSKRELGFERDNAESNKEHALQSIDASLRLLNLATNTDIEIPVSQYERMLGQGAQARRRHY
jgi:hypothetical protein